MVYPSFHAEERTCMSAKLCPQSKQNHLVGNKLVPCSDHGGLKNNILGHFAETKPRQGQVGPHLDKNHTICLLHALVHNSSTIQKSRLMSAPIR